MHRARRAGLSALIVLVILLVGLVPAQQPRPTDGLPVADVSWPVSTLVVSEVQTGGTSASDEFVEVANQGAASVDLGGLELVYVTSTGGTITRKATWTSPTLLEPGRRVLAANSAGIYAAIADSSYSGGLAATGGAMVLRVVGGTPIDAVGWGDAVNPFVEGTAASRAICRFEPRTTAGRWRRQRHRHERQRERFLRPGGAFAAERGGAAGARAGHHSDSHADAGAEPDTRSDADAHADPDRNADAPANADAPTDAFADPDADADPDTDPDAATRPNAHPCANAHRRSDADPGNDAHALADARAIAHAEPRTGSHRHRRRPAAAGRCHRHRSRAS